jgi:hypothetical protein
MNFKPFFSTKSPRTKVTTYCGLTHVNFTNMTSGISNGGKIFSAVGTLGTSVSCFSQSDFRFEGALGRGHQISWVKTSYCKNQWIRGLTCYKMDIVSDQLYKMPGQPKQNLFLNLLYSHAQNQWVFFYSHYRGAHGLFGFYKKYFLIEITSKLY